MCLGHSEVGLIGVGNRGPIGGVVEVDIEGYHFHIRVSFSLSVDFVLCRKTALFLLKATRYIT